MKATKRFAALCLALMLAVCFAGLALAADKPATPATPAVKAATSAVPAAPAAKAVAPAAPAVKTININKATDKELTQIKGVNAKLAKAIVAYRAKKGAFKAAEDLLKVRGFSKKILEQNKALIVVK
jgi:competence ComEA-like helix-hairpin-helix protein